MRGWTEEDVRRVRRRRTERELEAKAKGSKLHNVKSEARGDIFPELAGHRFDSKLERDRACELVLLQRAGAIEHLEFQKSVTLREADRVKKTKRVAYRADFRYVETHTPHPGATPEKRVVYEEAKGMRKSRWIMIRDNWPDWGPALLRITVRGFGNRIVTKQEIEPDEITETAE